MVFKFLSLFANKIIKNDTYRVYTKRTKLRKVKVNFVDFEVYCNYCRCTCGCHVIPDENLISL